MIADVTDRLGRTRWDDAVSSRIAHISKMEKSQRLRHLCLVNFSFPLSNRDLQYLQPVTDIPAITNQLTVGFTRPYLRYPLVSLFSFETKGGRVGRDQLSL